MKETFQRLNEIAETQQGFFTTQQAKAAGFDERNHAYHVRSGNWVREHRGIYRLATFPQTARPDLVLWSLWSRNRSGKVEGVYSHETALSIYDLSDLNPSRLHMTVPKTFRRMNKIPKILVLHKEPLSPADIVRRDGYLVTRPMRAIADLIDSDDTDQEFLHQALREGLNRGLITRAELSNRTYSDAAKNYFRNFLGDIEYESINKVRKSNRVPKGIGRSTSRSVKDRRSRSSKA